MELRRNWIGRGNDTWIDAARDPLPLQTDPLRVGRADGGFWLPRRAIGRSDLHFLRMDQPGALSTVRQANRGCRGTTSSRSNARESGGVARESLRSAKIWDGG